MLEINEKGKEKYPLVFSPLKIGNLTIPNRILFPPWCFNWANEDGTISTKLHNLYVNLALNGCGTIYIGAASVSKDSISFEHCVRVFNRDNVKSNKKLCKAIEEKDAIPAIQLMNFGRQSVTTFTGQPVLAPSDVPCPVSSHIDPNYRIKVMTLEDIHRVQNDFVNGAVFAAEAGYKIIQIQAGHGYLLNSFLSPYSNKRTDEYGGSVENRCRMLVETIQAIRKKIGSSVVLDVRLSVDELVDGGLIPNDYTTITPLIEEAGVDMMSASMSVFESALRIFPTPLEPEGRYAYTAETLKKYTSLPVTHTGFMGSLEKGEELISAGDTDMVGFGRRQFADQSFVKKSVNNEKTNECVWCGRCLGDLYDPQQNFTVHCTVNRKYKRHTSTVKRSA